MIPVTVYFDDSGTHPEANTAIAACYVSSMEKWNLFESEWKALANEEGFSAFHMSEFAAGKGEFSGWDDTKRKHVLGKLCALINIRVRTGFVVAVRKRDYDDLIQGSFREYCGEQHYTFVLRHCATGLREGRKKFEPSSTLRYVFDQMGKGKGEIMRVMDEAKAISQSEALETGIVTLKGYSFDDKADILPLQAADILAWTFFQYTQFLTVKRPLNWIAREALTTIQKAPIMNVVYTRESLARWAMKEQEVLEHVRGTGVITGRRYHL